MKPEEQMKKRDEFTKDLDARRPWHRVMNYHYLQYKGISLLNQQYSKEVLESLGMSINVPRTFMTIEAIRPDLERPMDIQAKWRNPTEKDQAYRVQQMLKGEWKRGHADFEKAKAEFDALLYGTGYLLNYFELDEEITDVFKEWDKEGRAVYEKGKQKNYEGMKIEWLDPYYVIPDRKAKTYQPGKHNSPRRIWVVSIWDIDEWKEECKKKGYKFDGVKSGGFTEELDVVRRQIDAIYTKLSNKQRTETGQLITQSMTDTPRESSEDMVGIVYEYTKHNVNIYAGEEFTVCYEGKNPFPKKEIPVYALKDYDIPGELEGVGEAEVLRWQQYEENKIHNLMYLQVIMNTVKRYGVVESLLEDPTQLRSSKILEPLKLKYMQGVKVGDAVQVLDMASANDVPLNVLNEVKTIGQMATGQTDYAIGANEGDAGTLGEANMMSEAGTKRVKQKIQQMEERGLQPILESWMSAIPTLYTDELDFLLNDGTNGSVKFLPFNRDMNKNAQLVATFAVKYGTMGVKTVEEVFQKIGYKDVVFVSDLLGGFDITIKTSLAFLDRNNMIRQYREAIATAQADNQGRIAMGTPPRWDTSKMTEDLLRQFSDIVDDVSDYELEAPQMPAQQVPATEVPAIEEQPADIIT